MTQEIEAAAIEAIVARYVGSGRVVGTVILVQKAGRPRHRIVAGFADREAERPVTEETVFRLASMTKPIVSVATLALAEAGLLDLDDPVTRFLPDFTPHLPDDTVPVITFRHLLTHTAGLDYGFLQQSEGAYARAGVSDGLDRPGIDLAENLRRLATVPLLFAPGTRWHYSVATDVLGAAIAAAAGEPLPAVVADYVTRPLAMADTHFVAPEPGRLARPYVDAGRPGAPAQLMDDPEVHQPPDGGPIRYAPSRAIDPGAFPSGGAGMVGTAGDYMRFLEALRLGGAPVLRQESVAGFQGDAIAGLEADLAGPGFGFGLGVAHLRDPAAANSPMAAGSWSWGGVYGTSFFVDPEAGLSVVALTNTALEGSDGDFVREVTLALYGGTSRQDDSAEP